MPKDQKYNYLENGHLTDEAISLYVDAFREGRLQDLPEDVQKHLRECSDCKKQVIELNSLIHKLSEKPAGNLNYSKRYAYLKYATIAASVLLFILLAWFLPSVLRNDQHAEEIFAEYFVPYPDVITMKSGISDESSKPLLAGLELYSDQKYDSALMFFAAIDELHPDHHVARFYEAICILSLDAETDDAILRLKIAKQLGKLNELSVWYLALAYLRNEKLDSASYYLKHYADSNSQYKSKAIELLNKIPEIR